MAVKRPKPKPHVVKKSKQVKRPDAELKRLENATKRARLPKLPEAPVVVSSRVEPVVVQKEVPAIEQEAPPAQELPQDEPEEMPGEEKAPPSHERSFIIGDAIEFASKHIKSRMKFYFGIMVVIFIFAFMGGMKLYNLIYGDGTGAGTVVFFSLIVSGLIAGLGRLALDLVEGKTAEFKELFSCFSVIHWFIVGMVIYWLIVAAGLALLIIPGVIWMLAFSQWLFVLVDTKQNPFVCLKKSVALTEGVKGKLLIFWLALFGINILGALALLVGLFITIPLSIIASAHVYDQLRKSA